jgi:hypothetical protein
MEIFLLNIRQIVTSFQWFNLNFQLIYSYFLNFSRALHFSIVPEKYVIANLVLQNDLSADSNLGTVLILVPDKLNLIFDFLVTDLVRIYF